MVVVSAVLVVVVVVVVSTLPSHEEKMRSRRGPKRQFNHQNRTFEDRSWSPKKAFSNTTVHSSEESYGQASVGTPI